MSHTTSLLPIVELIHDDEMPEVFTTEEPGVMRDKEDNHYVPVLEDRNGHWFWKRLGLDEAHEIYTRSWTREDRQAEYYDGSGADQ